MKVIENKIIPPKGYKAITIGPYIFVKSGTKLSEKDYNHEAIHWEQYKETLVIGFFLIYVIEFIYKFIFVYRGEWKKTYHNLSMEKEAYLNQDNLDYIKNRKHYKWIKL